MTPSGIEPATFRFVAQHHNHCATAVPVKWGSFTKNKAQEQSWLFNSIYWKVYKCVWRYLHRTAPGFIISCTGTSPVILLLAFWQWFHLNKSHLPPVCDCETFYLQPLKKFYYNNSSNHSNAIITSLNISLESEFRTLSWDFASLLETCCSLKWRITFTFHFFHSSMQEHHESSSEVQPSGLSLNRTECYSR